MEPPSQSLIDEIISTIRLNITLMPQGGFVADLEQVAKAVASTYDLHERRAIHNKSFAQMNATIIALWNLWESGQDAIDKRRNTRQG